MRSIRLTILVSSLLLTLSGCASQTDLVNLQRDTEEFKNRLLKTEQELSGVRSSTRDDVDKTIKSSQKDIDDVRKSTAELQASLEGVRVDMQVLSGKLDDAGVAAKKPADDLALLKEDIERRFTALDDKFTRLAKDMDELKKTQAEAKKEPEKPEALYQGGLDLLKKGETAKAREQLQKFLELYPKNDLAANAHYWIGETWYQEKKYEQAILEFQDVIKNYPDKEKVAAALLKQGLAFHEIKDDKSARYVLRKLAEDYAGTEEGKLAKEKLKQLK